MIEKKTSEPERCAKEIYHTTSPPHKHAGPAFFSPLGLANPHHAPNTDASREIALTAGRVRPVVAVVPTCETPRCDGAGAAATRSDAGRTNAPPMGVATGRASRRGDRSRSKSIAVGTPKMSFLVMADRTPFRTTRTANVFHIICGSMRMPLKSQHCPDQARIKWKRSTC